MLIHTTEEWFRYKLPYRRRPSRSRDAYFIH